MKAANTEELKFAFTIDSFLSDDVTSGKTNVFNITVPLIPKVLDNTAPFFEFEVPTYKLV